MKIKPCNVGTPIQAREYYPNGPRIARIIYNYKHRWIRINGEKTCLNCGKKYSEMARPA